MTTETKISDVDSTTILKLAQAYWAAKTILSAAELNLFTVLAEAPATEAEIRERLGLHPRATQDFLDALVGLGLLAVEDGRYRNGDAADLYLDENKPSYVGGFLKLLNFHYNLWGGLTDLLRTGNSQLKGGQDFSKLYANPAGVRNFMVAMDGAAADVGPALAQEFDWSAHESFIDVGGARGNLAAEIVKAHPHLRGACYDLPQVEPFFHEHMEQLGMVDRVVYESGDFFHDPMPSAEVIVFGHVLHDWNDDNRMTLLRKAYDALPEGGCVLIYDALTDNNPANFLRSLNMRLVTPGGSEYSEASCNGWLEDAGFTGISVKPLVGPDMLVVGYKPAG
ncbi:methyltransferase [Amycolatopsis nigrescens]|uniref:methyltransferase n=1 Tax=Amycolatopsis nigrescens TaxID=381445 RepID=UPI0003618BF6|nr:methyltransferase [Amycolatopsis nigrescens]